MHDDDDGLGRGIGVGPWQGEPPPGVGTRYDPDLLAHGDRRNVVDSYRYWTVDAVVADLDTRRHPLHVAIENFQHDANIGSVVRTANAMNVAGVHVIGRRKWNRRGAMVTDRYLSVHHHDDASALCAWARAQDPPLAVVALENSHGAVPIEEFDLPSPMVLLVGQEGPGLSEETVELCDAAVSISQFGSTRSLNAGAAAAIAMHAWVRRHVFGQHPGATTFRR